MIDGLVFYARSTFVLEIACHRLVNGRYLLECITASVIFLHLIGDY